MSVYSKCITEMRSTLISKCLKDIQKHLKYNGINLSFIIQDNMLIWKNVQIKKKLYNIKFVLNAQILPIMEEQNILECLSGHIRLYNLRGERVYKRRLGFPKPSYKNNYNEGFSTEWDMNKFFEIIVIFIKGIKTNKKLYKLLKK